MENVLHKSSNIEERKWIYAIAVLFISSRIIIFLSGISFDVGSIVNGTWQLISPELLKNNLLESIYYLHSQPPLYNLYVGLVLKLFPENYAIFFHFNFLILGLLMHTTLYVIMRQLGIRVILAFILTALLMLSPSIILYENWLSYTYIVIALLTFSAFFLLRFLYSEKFSDGFLFFLFLGVTVLTRSMYHIVWFAVIIILLLLIRNKIRKKIVLTAVIPFLIVFAFFFKNYILFNTFSTSSWMGMSLYEISISRIDKKKLEPLVASGEASPIVLVPAFWSLDHYTEFITKTNPYPSVRVLTDSFNLKEANYHNYHYLEVSELYKKSAIKVISHYPLDYLKNVALSFGYYFYPASNYPLLDQNINKMFWYNKLYNHIILWTIYNPEEVDRKPPFRIEYALSLSFLTIVGFVFCALVSVQQIWKNRKLKLFSLSPSIVVLTFLALTILYTMAVGNFFEQGENMRFRFQTSTFCIIFLGITINSLLPQKGANHNLK